MKRGQKTQRARCYFFLYEHCNKFKAVVGEQNIHERQVLNERSDFLSTSGG